MILSSKRLYSLFGIIKYSTANSIPNNQVETYFDIRTYQKNSMLHKKQRFFIPSCLVCGKLGKSPKDLFENSTYMLTFIGLQNFIGLFCSPSCYKYFHEEPSTYLKSKSFPKSKLYLGKRFWYNLSLGAVLCLSLIFYLMI